MNGKHVAQQMVKPMMVHELAIVMMIALLVMCVLYVIVASLLIHGARKVQDI